MVVSFQTVLAERAEASVQHANAVTTRWNLDTCGIWKIIGATKNGESARWNIDAALRDVIPLSQIVRRLGVVDLDYDRNGHVACWINDDDVGCNLDATLQILVGDVAGNRRLGFVVYEVELEEVCEQLELVLLHAHIRRRN